MRAAIDSIPTRQSLLLRLRQLDNRESWKEFFDTYWPLIYAMALHSGLSDAEAQDVVQETIISVARSMPNFRYDPKIGSFKSWLRKLTRWRILDQVRKRNPRTISFGDLDVIVGPSSERPDESDVSFETIWETEWQNALVQAAAERTKAKVNGNQYQIFDLYVLRKWPIEKIAKDLRITRGKIFVSSHRVQKVFNEQLKKLNLEGGI